MSPAHNNTTAPIPPNYAGELRKRVAGVFVVHLAHVGQRPVAVVARELGLVEGTLGNWVNAYRKNHPVEDRPLEMHDRARLKELERENRELRMQNDFLKKAAAFFAQDHR